MTGTIRDAVTRETLPGAHVVATDGTQTWGAVSDAAGRYSLPLPDGPPVAVRVSFVGYQPKEFRGYRDAYLDHDLAPGVNLPEVVIRPEEQAGASGGWGWLLAAAGAYVLAKKAGYL